MTQRDVPVPTVTAAEIAAAAERIRGHVRHTPMLDPAPLKTPLFAAGTRAQVLLKLECLQVTGSFKPRGAVNKLSTLDRTEMAAGVVTASGGNHGLAVAYAAWSMGVPPVILLPASTPTAKVDKLRRWGAEVMVAGNVWDEANEAALQAGRDRHLLYVHPFADPAVIAGQGTLGLEILDQVPEADTLVVAIGGGGLIAGVAAAAKARKPWIRIIGVEPVGAPTLFESLKAGHVVTLDRIETAAGSLAPRRSMPINLAMIREHVERIVLVSDEEMREAARWLWFETGVAAELSGAAALAAVSTGRYLPEPGETIVAIICGAGSDGIPQASEQT